MPSSMHSLAPFREMIVLKSLNVAVTEAGRPNGSATTTTPPPAPVAKLSLMVAFSRVSEPFRRRSPRRNPRHCSPCPGSQIDSALPPVHIVVGERAVADTTVPP